MLKIVRGARSIDVKSQNATLIVKKRGSTMNFNHDVGNLIKRIRRNGLIKSALLSVFVAFLAVAVFAAVGWFVGFKLIWLYAVAFVGVFACAFPMLYFIKYKCTAEQAAAKIDALGLEERILTRKKLENDDSYIARRQRADALEALSKVNEKRLSFVLSTALIIGLTLSAELCIGMSTLSALAANNVIGSGKDYVSGEPNEVVSYHLTYMAGDGGTLLGELAQTVNEGENGTYVIAIPDEGYVFVKWSDASKKSVRIDQEVTANVTVTAVFEKLDDFSANEDLLNSNSSGNSNKIPGSNKKGDVDMPPDENNKNNGPGNNDSSAGGAGGQFDPNNQIIDGDTYYGDTVYDNAVNDANNRVNSDGSMSDGQKDVIGGYYDGIEK